MMVADLLFDMELLVDDIPDTPALHAKTERRQTGAGGENTEWFHTVALLV
jgi:hypothetical protein